MEKQYKGACHCGTVRFRISSALDHVTSCDCSLCVKKNAVMTAVHETKFELLSGEDALSCYTWNTKVAQHYFCSKCGIYTFHRKRSMPDHFGVNLHCLEDLDVNALKIKKVDGISMSLVHESSNGDDQ
ncbi:GFA family protein [Maritalea sp.]|uniref:GFA family protein n=1 Tax=Maritalea sp. TaxID=2003361 RepID=UPI003EF1C628